MSDHEAGSLPRAFDDSQKDGDPGQEAEVDSPIKQWMVLAGVVTAGTLLSVLIGSAVIGRELNGLYLLEIAFLWNNVVFCILEIACLYFGRDYLREQFARIDGGLEGRGFEMVLASFVAPVSRRNLFSREDWSKMFIGWGVLDRDYATQNSFGYLGETGNGVLSVIPTCLLLAGMVFPIMPARVLGIIGVAFGYQTIWASSVYVLGLWKFADNSENSAMANAFLIGGNFLWIIPSIFVVYTSVRLILEDSFRVFFA